jgi:hypothetical protein
MTPPPRQSLSALSRSVEKGRSFSEKKATIPSGAWKHRPSGTGDGLTFTHIITNPDESVTTLSVDAFLWGVAG